MDDSNDKEDLIKIIPYEYIIYHYYYLFFNLIHA